MVNKDQVFTDAEFVRLPFNDLNDNSYTLDSEGRVVKRVSLSGGGSGASAGGNSVLVGKDVGSAVFDASAQTITFSGLGTLDISQIQSIVNLTDNITIYNPGSSSTGGSLSGNVLTLTYDTTSMSDSDDLQIYVYFVNDQDYDAGASKVLELNPEWAHYTNSFQLINDTDVAAATYRKVFNRESYRGASLHLRCSGGVIMTVWGSNDPDADNTADTGWVDLSNSIIGAANLTDGEGLYFIDTDQMTDKMMIKYVTSDATNAIDAFIKQY